MLHTQILFHTFCINSMSLSSNSAFNLFNSKVEGGCWGWLLELLCDWLGSLLFPDLTLLMAV